MCTKPERLKELLSIVESYKGFSSSFIRDIFKEDHAFKELGAGFFSQVFLHREYPEYAIKVCYRETDSWPFFAKYCMDNADNPEVNFLLPRIHAFHKTSSRGLYIAVVDKLETIAPYGNIVDEHLVNTEATKQIHAIAAGFKESGSLSWRDLSKCKVLDDRYLRAASMIYDDLKMFCAIDLHGGNLMKDAEGDIIVTDPVSFSPKESSEAKIEELDCMLRGVQYTGAQPKPRRRDIISTNRLFTGTLTKFLRRTSVKGIGADLIINDFATLERKVMAIQAKEDDMPSNVGVVKRNAFLARKLGHHM